MVRLTNLHIEFDPPIAYSGQLLKGWINFELKRAEKLKSLILRLEGKTRITLPAGLSSSSEQSQEKVLLKRDFNLSHLVNQQSRAPPGAHRLPFALPLPPDLPSSLGGEDKLGYVFYSAKITIRSSSSKYKAREPFTVIGVEDLNWHPYAALPVTCREESSAPSFWSIFSRRNAHHGIGVVLQLERTGFVPGESIRINAEITNNSSRRIRQTVAQIRQGIMYATGKRRKEVNNIVGQRLRPEIHPGGMDRWDWEELRIPHEVPPSFLRGSPFITVKYDLVFLVDPPGSVAMTVPLIIGTVPYLPANLKSVLLQALPWKPNDSVYGFAKNPQNAAAIYGFSGGVNDYGSKTVQLTAEQNGHCLKNGSVKDDRSGIKIEEID